MEYLRTHGTYIAKPRWVFETFTIYGEEEITYPVFFGDFDPPDMDTLDYVLYRFGIKNANDGVRATVTFTADGSIMENGEKHRFTAEKIFPSKTWRVIEQEVVE